jgi:Ca2+-binding RTX toxin-like protein
VDPTIPDAGCGGLTPTISGTEASDILVGTEGADVIAGLGGDDDVRAGSGHDVICGGIGNDTLRGDAGNDRLFGDGASAPKPSTRSCRLELEGVDQCREAVRVVRHAEVSGRSDERPAPGSSQATSVNSSARAASCGRHTRLSSRAPCTKTSGGPSPTRS